MNESKNKYLIGVVAVLLFIALVFIKMNEVKDTPLQQLHTETLHRFTYLTDEELYGVEDRWAVNCRQGDCEDYALCIRDKLGKGDVLIVRTTEGVMHAVLDVDGFIVDNLDKRVYKLEDMPHKLIARVKEGNPAYANVLRN